MTSRTVPSAFGVLVFGLFVGGCAESGLPAGELPDLGVVPDLRGACPAQPAFGRTAHYAIGPNVSFLHAIADLDRDGRGDLLATGSGVFSGQLDELVVAYGQPGGGFRAPLLLRSAELLGPTVAGDLDGDGWLDLVTAEEVRSVLLVLRNGGGGGGDRFSVAAEIPVPENPHELGLADLDADGDLDLVVNGSGYRGMEILLNQGGLGFARRGTVLHHGVATIGLSVADMNGDRRPDLIVANHNENTVTVYSGRGDGSFAGADFPVGGLTMAVSVGDVDGDRAPDVITADLKSRYLLLRNRGDGSLEAPAPLPFPDAIPSQRLAIADVTGDGLPELFYVHLRAQSAGVLVNAGGGRFRPPRHFPIGREAYGIQLADLDGDRALDLVMASIDGPREDPATTAHATVLYNLCSP